MGRHWFTSCLQKSVTHKKEKEENWGRGVLGMISREKVICIVTTEKFQEKKRYGNKAIPSLKGNVLRGLMCRGGGKKQSKVKQKLDQLKAPLRVSRAKFCSTFASVGNS